MVAVTVISIYIVVFLMHELRDLIIFFSGFHISPKAERVSTH